MMRHILYGYTDHSVVYYMTQDEVLGYKFCCEDDEQLGIMKVITEEKY